MKCQTCGHDNNAEDAQFCGVCGIKQDQSAASVSEVRSEASSRGSSGELPMVEFGEAIGRGFKNYFNFSGRATRAELWWFVLFTQIISLISIIPILGWIISFVGSIAIIIPSISLSARRLHDIGRSAWWLSVWLLLVGAWVLWVIGFVIALIGIGETPYITDEEAWAIIKPWMVRAVIIIVVNIGLGIWWLVWFVKKGDKGPNKYGPDPRQPTSQ